MDGPGWRTPPEALVRVLDAPVAPRLRLSPRRDRVLLLHHPPIPPVALLARSMARVAGLRLAAPAAALWRTRFYDRVDVVDLPGGETRRIKLPAGARAYSVCWSPDGAKFAFLNETEGGTELWVAEPLTGACRPMTGPRVNATLGRAYAWTGDGRRILLRRIPEGRGPGPRLDALPTPEPRETCGKRSRNRTYQDLLSSAHDEALFEHHVNAELRLLDVDGCAERALGDPGPVHGFAPSPDGHHVLVQRLRPPWSRLVPWSLFGRAVEVFGHDGAREALLDERPAAEEVPADGVREGAREVRWHPLEPATLLFVEALDGGDPAADVPHRDRLMAAAAPDFEPRELRRVAGRFRSLDVLQTGEGALLTEGDWRRRWLTTTLVDLKGRQEDRVLFDRSQGDAYRDPGSPVTTTLPTGGSAVLVRGGALWFAGPGATPEGNRPFLRQVDLGDLSSVQVFRSSEAAHEEFVGFVRDSVDDLLVSRETPTEPPMLLVVPRKNPAARGAVTHAINRIPEFTAVERRLLTYRRADGVELSGVLHLPPERRPGERLPALIWAYPLDYGDPDTAGQVRLSKTRFPRLDRRWQQLVTLAGYALLDRAQVPVVGDPTTMNDSFVEQVVASARAARAALADTGLVDPARVAIGGVSYGAFMVANVVAGCPDFAAAIACSGSYNRTLTPFGFQAERRSLWEAPGIYERLSPFNHADRIRTPLLLLHGERDENPGTWPMQSERLFQALQGLGATARLVVLPLEGHHYVARETLLHAVAEIVAWMDRYLKRREETKE